MAAGVPTHTPHGARAGATLPSTTGGVLLVGGASGVVVGGKRTLKSQNWDVGCRSSDSVSNASPAPLLPMAGSAGILRAAPSQTAFYNFYAGPAKRHPGCRGGESCKGLAMRRRRRRDGEGRRTGLMDKPWPVKTSPGVPRGSFCPESCAQGCCTLSSFPVPQCPFAVFWGGGCHVLAPAQFSRGKPPRAAHSLPW